MSSSGKVCITPQDKKRLEDAASVSFMSAATLGSLAGISAMANTPGKTSFMLLLGAGLFALGGGISRGIIDTQCPNL